MKNKLASFFVWFLVILCFCAPFLAEFSYLFEDMNLNPNDYARITDVDYKAVVVDEPGGEGKVVITERLTFDIHAADIDNPFWELWRDLPEDYVDGVKVDYKVNSVKQILPDGTELVYEESPKLYWDDFDYVSPAYGPYKWYHSEGPYSESAAQYECVFFYVNGIYREQVVYEIEYEMHNAALRYNDCSDLYLALYSGNTIKHLDSYKAQILFPNEDMPSPGNYEVYTYGTNANEFPVKESDTMNPGYHTFYFELDENDLQFKPYNEYIEFDLVSYNEDKHIFTEYAPSNTYTYDDVLPEIYDEQRDYATAPALFRIIKVIVFIIFALLSGVALLYCFTYDKRIRSKYTFYEPTENPEYYRDIPSDLDPNFAAELVFCKENSPKDDSGVYSAILLSLARKKYIELTEKSSNDVIITINPDGLNDAFNPKPQPAAIITPNPMLGYPGLPTEPVMTDPVYTEAAEPLEPLTLCEEYYYNLLVRHMAGDSMTMSYFQARVSSDYENTQTFARNMKNSIVNIGIKDRYFQKADYKQPKNATLALSRFLLISGLLVAILGNIISYQTRLDLAFGGWTLLGVTCIVSAIYLKKTAKKYVLLTQAGENEYAKWRGLYNFLNSETLMHERSYIELPLWEQYLVYATAFGLSEKVIKAIDLRCPEASESQILNNNYCRSGRYRYSGRSFRSSVRSGSSYSGGGGGGFGYGGGGRGGGGGGGGH